MNEAPEPGLRRAVALVAALNLGWFGVEFAAALSIGSVALFADSIDFLEDAAINTLVFLAVAWSVPARTRLARLMALIILVPSVAALWQAVEKIGEPVAPDAVLLSLIGTGALAVNLTAAAILARHRTAGGSLMRAAFLSARNDAVANVAIIAAGIVTATLWPSAWPDIIVGAAIAALNLDAAREVWTAAADEDREGAA